MELGVKYIWSDVSPILMWQQKRFQRRLGRSITSCQSRLLRCALYMSSSCPFFLFAFLMPVISLYAIPSLDILWPIIVPSRYTINWGKCISLYECFADYDPFRTDSLIEASRALNLLKVHNFSRIEWSILIFRQIHVSV